jgi:peptidyl-prolyl cis-trans isomerase A (cyclophilin A)
MKYVRKSGWYLAAISVAVVVLASGCRASKKNVEGRTVIKLETTKGNIVIEVNEQAAPVTSANFLRYAKEGFYNGVIFHRVIPGFMIQTGGFTPDMKQKPAREPIISEASNGLKNTRGTVAMARTSDPNSASSQFFINQVNNNYLDYVQGKNAGYAVFGKVVEGMDVVETIAQVKTATNGLHQNVPVQPVIIKSAKVTSGK